MEKKQVNDKINRTQHINLAGGFKGSDLCDKSTKAKSYTKHISAFHVRGRLPEDKQREKPEDCIGLMQLMDSI